jgi:hypothetical protein
MSDKPTSAGLWEREETGEKIDVRNMLDDPGAWRLRGFRADGREVELSMLPGNWRKLTAASDDQDGLRQIIELHKAKLEVLLEKIRKYKHTLVDRQDFSAAAAVRDVELLVDRMIQQQPATEATPAPPEVIDWQRLREWAADPRKKVPELAFTSGPEREIADLIMMCRVSIEPPEVIEHLKAEILAWREADLYCDMLGKMAGDYDKESDERGTILRDLVRVARDANDEAGYFPPRPTFTAPDKPELVRVRYKDREDHYARRDGENFRLASGRLLYGINCEVIG